MSMWNSWKTVELADGYNVLVKFKFPDGTTNIDEVTIRYHYNLEEAEYWLKDGAIYNTSIIPIEWMWIPH